MIAVAGGKGGCGKTTTTACLARALAERGSSPIVVDCDLDMPDLHVVTGGRREPGLPALADGAPLEDVAQSALELPGVRHVASGGGSSTDLSPVLDRLRSRSNPVLVDTPAGASPDVATPLRAADATLLVSTPTRQSLADAVKTAAMARTLDAPVIATVLTRSDGSVDPRSLLDTEHVHHVPTADAPLANDAVEAAYDRIAATVTERNI